MIAESAYPFLQCLGLIVIGLHVAGGAFVVGLYGLCHWARKHYEAAKF